MEIIKQSVPFALNELFAGREGLKKKIIKNSTSPSRQFGVIADR